MQLQLMVVQCQQVSAVLVGGMGREEKLYGGFSHTSSYSAAQSTNETAKGENGLRMMDRWEVSGL